MIHDTLSPRDFVDGSFAGHVYKALATKFSTVS